MQLWQAQNVVKGSAGVRASTNNVTFTLVTLQLAGLSSLRMFRATCNVREINACARCGRTRPSNREMDMALPIGKFLSGAALLTLGAFAVYYGFRRPATCAGDGLLVATQTGCVALGLDAANCKSAIEKARAVAARAAPRHESSFQCELQYSECFEAGGSFVPRPSFCLRKDDKTATPSEIRYLEYVSDRQNRRTTKEVRIE
jgi:hypothetical protein